MRKYSVAMCILFLATLLGCRNDRKYTEVKQLSEFEKTQFIPTLEHTLSADKNAVYCATLLFAWDEIRKKIQSPLIIPDEHADLKLLNQSTSFEKILKSNEYTVKAQVAEYLISVKAEFNKSLPFEVKLQQFNNRLTFDGQKVASFGVKGYDSSEELRMVEILYYQDDYNFILKLVPKDQEHEILLYKTEQRFSSIAEMTGEIEKRIEIGKAEKKSAKTSGHYQYNDEDMVAIPMFNFNIETNYSSLEGNRFSKDLENFQIERAWQRTAFILDESGAEVESEAEFFAVAVEEIEDEYEKPQPKLMIFDKPFLILLKRTDSKNPYLALWITNTELMIKE